MAGATIGDDISTLYEFEWNDGSSRTTDEIGDLDEAGFDCTMDDVVDRARADPDCTVRILGFDKE